VVSPSNTNVVVLSNPDATKANVAVGALTPRCRNRRAV
jgi:hypothetical protein